MAVRLFSWFHRVRTLHFVTQRTPCSGHPRGLTSLLSRPCLCLRIQMQTCGWQLPQQGEKSVYYNCLQARCYSKKGKDKGGKSKKDKGRRMWSDEDLLEVIDADKLQSEMQHVVDKLKHDYLTQLNLRITTGTFDTVAVSTAEGRFPLNQLGQIIQKSPDRIHINMASNPQYVADAREAIVKMELNVTPQQDGTSIFIQIPKLTKEHRELLAKSAKVYSDKSKDQLRDVYKKYSKKVHAAKSSLSEDLIRNAEIAVLEVLHTYQDQLEELMQAKKQDLLNVK